MQIDWFEIASAQKNLRFPETWAKPSLTNQSDRHHYWNARARVVIDITNNSHPCLWYESYDNHLAEALMESMSRFLPPALKVFWMGDKSVETDEMAEISASPKTGFVPRLAGVGLASNPNRLHSEKGGKQWEWGQARRQRRNENYIHVNIVEPPQ